LKTDVSVPTVRNKQKKACWKKSFFGWHLESYGQKEQDPDPYQNVKDPEH
jgi:hypothetical protein